MAARLAIDAPAAGVYNIAEPNDAVATDNARRLLRRNPAFRMAKGTRP